MRPMILTWWSSVRWRSAWPGSLVPMSDPVPGLTSIVERHLRDLMDAESRRVDERFTSQQRAIEEVASRTAADKASANEWRGAMVDRESRFVTVEAHAALVEKVNDQGSRQVADAGRSAGVKIALAALVTIVTLLAAVAGVILAFNS